MSEHLTEEQQVEEIKKWWSENSRSVIGGAVIGLGLVFGWQGWGQYQQGQAEQASAEYDRMLVAMRSGNTEAGAELAKRLMSSHSDRAYGYFAALDLARQRVADNDLAGARAELEWAVAHANDAALVELARLRLARVLVAQQAYDEAKATIAQAQTTSFAGDFSVLRGDIARYQGDLNGARQAYREALTKGASNPALVQIKLDDIAAPAS